MGVFFLGLSCKWGYALNFSSAADLVGSPSSCSALLTLTLLAQSSTINHIQEPIQAFEEWILQGKSVPVPAMLWQRCLKPHITLPVSWNRCISCIWMDIECMCIGCSWMFTHSVVSGSKVATERKLKKDAKLQSVTSWSVHVFLQWNLTVY